jgi:hypothetical protein
MLAVQQREEKDMKIIQIYHIDTIHNTQIIDDEMLSNHFGNVLVSLFSAFEVLTIWTAALTRIPIALVQQRTSHVSRRRTTDQDMASPWISCTWLFSNGNTTLW